MNIGDKLVPLTCHSCNRSFNTTVNKIENQTPISCPFCKQEIQVSEKTRDFVQEFRNQDPESTIQETSCFKCGNITTYKLSQMIRGEHLKCPVCGFKWRLVDQGHRMKKLIEDAKKSETAMLIKINFQKPP